MSYRNLGEIAQKEKQPDWELVRENFYKGLEIAKRLAEMDPENKKKLRDLCTTSERLAEIAEQDGKYRDAVQITEDTLKWAKANNRNTAFPELYGCQSWYLLLVKEFGKAQEAAVLGLKEDRNNKFLLINLAHSHLLQDQYEEAKAIYLEHTDEQVDQKKWRDIIAADFLKLRAAGLDPPKMKQIEKFLGIGNDFSGKH